MSDEGCFTLRSKILYDLWVKLYEYLLRGCEKACQKAWPPVNVNCNL